MAILSTTKIFNKIQETYIAMLTFHVGIGNANVKRNKQNTNHNGGEIDAHGDVCDKKKRTVPFGSCN